MVNQKDIIDRIASKTDLKKQDIKKMLLAFREVIYDAISDGENIFFKNVFTIKPIDIKGRNRYIAPYRKEIYQEEHKSVKMIPSKNLINVVREK